MSAFTRRTILFAFAVLSCTAFNRATAQGPGGRGGGGRGPSESVRRGPDGSDAERAFKDMASLKHATKGVGGLDKMQKDSLKRLESHYKEAFEGYGRAARAIAEDTSRSGVQSKLEQVRRLTRDAEALREEELGAVRSLFTTDAQRSRFDANVAALTGEAAKRDSARKDRR